MADKNIDVSDIHILCFPKRLRNKTHGSGLSLEKIIRLMKQHPARVFVIVIIKQMFILFIKSAIVGNGNFNQRFGV